ncbi:MAG: regulatory iron-sulfur-containing complex subunit RicT [Chitinivibrionales bacterium]|nr:regulatory iron-sulfur-containing complex subunit RicT [Chitinivibrionales bacterium]
MSKNSKLVEVVFQGERRVIYRNRSELDINEGETVIVEADRGYDLGRVSLVGNLVRLKKGKGEARGIIRKALPEDLAAEQKNKEKEREAFKLCKQKIKTYNLDMKLVGVEMQFDGSKITFYFTAAQRVDFRELVKDLAGVYRTRIELRQIGVRDEAKRISGMGICGRKQCCSAFLNEFEQITTQMAKDQQLSLNPTKISGNCGRLLCCLRYEVDCYCEVIKQYPPVGSGIKINTKEGTLNYINVFTNNGFMHYQDGSEEWLTLEQIKKGTVTHGPQQK